MNTNPTILIVDDSSFMRKVLRDILESAGYTNFLEASNGKEAIEQYNNQKPDFVFLDIIMPDINGIDVLRAIGNDGKIVVVSAVGQKPIINEAKSLGAIDYVVKPFDREQVLSKVQKYLHD